MSTPFLKNYNLLKIPIIRENGLPAWPELFPESEIDRLRITVGARHFSAQMMMEFVAAERARLSPDSFQIYNLKFDDANARLGDILISGYSVYWDPSSGHSSSDGSVCVLALFDNNNKRAFLHDLIYLKVSDDDTHPMMTQCIRVLDFLQKHNLKNIGIEVNGLGNALPEIMRRESATRGQTISINRIINHERKEKRIIDAIEPLLSTGRLFANECIFETKLISEMENWTYSGANRDDGIDAVAGALRQNPSAIRTRAAQFGKISVANTDFKI
jgi:predicted phage terminase large subunit-like protein